MKRRVKGCEHRQSRGRIGQCCKRVATWINERNAEHVWLAEHVCGLLSMCVA